MNALKTGSFLLLVLFVQTGLSLECHTCNSDEDKGCTHENFKPTLTTNDYSKCEDSFKRTFQEAQAIVFPHYHNFPIEQIMTNNKSSDACVKFTVSGKDSPKKVTFRGCSVLGAHSCELLQTVVQAAGGTFEHCHQCLDKSMCNHARSTLPLVSAYLMAVLALAISIKF